LEASIETVGAYGAVSQACAMAIADAAVYLRNTQTIANTAIGVALEQILSGADATTAQQAIEIAQGSVLMAVGALGITGLTAAEILAHFPNSAPSSAA
jgi:hypothetical protein